MKRLDRLILKSFLGPLLLTFAIAVFVLLMQFVWKYIDDMVGKGLEFIIIAKLLLYASATFVPMALPIAVLFASIMTMGNFGEKYELVAMKAGGISLSRVMRPMAFVAFLLTGMAFYFANNVMPAAMLQYRSILYDVTRKKPAINIRPSEYYSEIDGYVIRVNKKDPDGSTMRDITIYDHTKGPLQNNIISAKSGKMQSSADEHYLIFTLYDGCTYSESMEGDDQHTRPLTRVNFKEQVLTFDVSSFAFDESDKKFFEGNYQMMNVSQLYAAAQALGEKSETRILDHQRTLLSRYHGLDTSAVDTTTIPDSTLAAIKSTHSFGNLSDLSLEPPVMPAIREKVEVKPWCVSKGTANIPDNNRRRIIQSAISEVQIQLDQVKMQQQIITSDIEYTNRHFIELHRKFTLSVACLLLFLVGAPFGSLVRKGGLGMPLVASVAFFVLYYVIGMICEKAVREAALPHIGMWVSSFVMLPIGILLTIQATTDRNLALGQWVGTLADKIKLRRKKKKAETSHIETNNPSQLHNNSESNNTVNNNNS